ncbi:LrgB family protein, partial [Acinetobacter baumannii]
MFMILYGFLITLVGYLCAKPLNRRFPQVPLLVFGMFIVIGLLSILKVPYEEYRLYVNDLFSHLLGYVTVALAIPLAAMRYDDLPLKSVIGILCFASISAVALPMGLAYLLHMSEPTILAFATRAVTTPIALNIATLLHAPET